MSSIDNQHLPCRQAADLWKVTPAVDISIRTLTLADLPVADRLNQAAFETQEIRIADMQRYRKA